MVCDLTLLCAHMHIVSILINELAWGAVITLCCTDTENMKMHDWYGHLSRMYTKKIKGQGYFNISGQEQGVVDQEKLITPVFG